MSMIESVYSYCLFNCGALSDLSCVAHLTLTFERRSVHSVCRRCCSSTVARFTHLTGAFCSQVLKHFQRTLRLMLLQGQYDHPHRWVAVSHEVLEFIIPRFAQILCAISTWNFRFMPCTFHNDGENNGGMRRRWSVESCRWRLWFQKM